MIARPWVWGGVIAATLLAGSAGPAVGTTRSAVLSGTVLSAPAEPVCMPRVPCLHPAGGVVLVFSRMGSPRAHVTTTKRGSYRIALAAGTYEVRVTRPEGIRRLKPKAVTLSAGQFKKVTFYLDTGIR